MYEKLTVIRVQKYTQMMGVCIISALVPKLTNKC